MSMQLPLTIGLALLAGGVGAVVTSAVTGPSSSSAPRSLSALDPAGDVALQLRELAASNAQVLERLGRLEERAALTVAAPGRTPAQAEHSAADLEAAVAAALAKMGSKDGAPAVVTPDFRKQVETVLALKAEEERLEREQERAQRESQMLEDRLARLQTDLGLDQRQVDGMRKAFQDADARREEMRNSMRDARDGGAPDFETMRTQWQALATAQDTQIQSILTPSQFEQYKASNPDPRMGGRGGMFGGGPGGAGQGGNNANGGNANGGNAGGGRRRGGNGGGGN
jgi:hypothetical protein